MPLCMEVDLGPGNIVLDGDPAHLPQKGHSPQFIPQNCQNWTGEYVANLVNVMQYVVVNVQPCSNMGRAYAIRYLHNDDFLSDIIGC